MKKKINNKLLLVLISLISLIIDLFSKIIVISYLKEMHNYKIISNFFSLFYIRNDGAAFSILEGKTTLLIILSIIFLLVLIKYIYNIKSINKLESISLGLITGGIIGNLIDRIIYGSVIDFLSFEIFNYNFPIFNLADSFIVIGVLLLSISFIKEEKSVKKTKSH